MTCSLLTHPMAYELTAKDAALSLLTLCSGSAYAVRHWQLSSSSTEMHVRWGHRVVSLIQFMPIVGAVAALTERLVIYIYLKMLGSFQTYQNPTQLEEIPSFLHDDPILSKYICPISHAPIRHPVGDPNCITIYDRKCIFAWLESNSISPVTRQPLKKEQLIPLCEMQSLIDDRLTALEPIIRPLWTKDPAQPTRRNNEIKLFTELSSLFKSFFSCFSNPTIRDTRDFRNHPLYPFPPFDSPFGALPLTRRADVFTSFSLRSPSFSEAHWMNSFPNYQESPPSLNQRAISWESFFSTGRLPFSSDKRIPSFFLHHLTSFTAFDVPIQPALRIKFEQTMKAIHQINAPPERPLPSWATMNMTQCAFQIDPQTTLLINPAVLTDFLQRATPEQKKAVKIQLAQLITQRKRANIHSTGKHIAEKAAEK